MALHVCMGPMQMCKAPCLCAKSSAYMQRRVFMCSSACICARPCSFVDPSARVHNPRVYFVADLACVQGGVFICKGPWIYAERRVDLHASVLVYSAVCLFARPHGRMHVSPDHFQGKLNLA